MTASTGGLDATATARHLEDEEDEEDEEEEEAEEAKEEEVVHYD